MFYKSYDLQKPNKLLSYDVIILMTGEELKRYQ